MAPLTRFGQLAASGSNDASTKKPRKTLGFPGFFEVEPKGVEPSTSALRTQRSPN